jgi:hypothetical protein
MSDPTERPAIATAPISVILLAEAFATETADALKSWRAYLESLRRPYEIVLIQETRPETATADNPAELANAARVFSYDRNVGLRDALNAAIAATQYPVLVFCTCDKQYQPPDLERMLKVIDKVDLVVAYRVGGQAPPWRVLFDMFVGLFSRVFLGIPLGPRMCWLGRKGWGRRWIARWVFGVRVQDPECPFRLARREVFKRWPFQSGGSFAQVEMLAKANHLTCLLAEEGVAWSPPTMPANEAILFGQDAWLVFRWPDFGSFAAPPAVVPTETSAPPQA